MQSRALAPIASHEGLNPKVRCRHIPVRKAHPLRQIGQIVGLCYQLLCPLLGLPNLRLGTLELGSNEQPYAEPATTQRPLNLSSPPVAWRAAFSQGCSDGQGGLSPPVTQPLPHGDFLRTPGRGTCSAFACMSIAHTGHPEPHSPTLPSRAAMRPARSSHRRNHEHLPT